MATRSWRTRLGAVGFPQPRRVAQTNRHLGESEYESGVAAESQGLYEEMSMML